MENSAIPPTSWRMQGMIAAAESGCGRWSRLREWCIDALTEPMTQTQSDHLDLDADRLREECGVFGIFGHPDAAALTALGLHALQHRGQEAAGIVSFDGKRFHSE